MTPSELKDHESTYPTEHSDIGTIATELEDTKHKLKQGEEVLQQ